MTTPFSSLDDYIALPRLTALTLSPDGRRLVATQQELNTERTAYTAALWEIDPAGLAPARRLTRGAKGEGGAAFTKSGDLLFVASRGEPGIAESEAKPCVWRLPAAGGEAHVVVRRPGGISSVLTGDKTDRIAVLADTLGSATDEATERDLRAARKDNKVNAILHTSYPVRYWDHDLGPDYPRLFAVEGEPLPAKAADEAGSSESAPSVNSGGANPGDANAAAMNSAAGSAAPTGVAHALDPDREFGTRDLTPDAGRALDGARLSPDGSYAVATWVVPEVKGGVRETLVRIDVATGARTTLLDFGPGGSDIFSGIPSPDGSRIAAFSYTRSTPDIAPELSLWVMNADGSDVRQLVPEWEREQPNEAVWLPDGSGLLVVADDHGHAPVFLVPLTGRGDDVVRLTADGSYSNLNISEDGRTVYALRASYSYPAEVVRFDLAAAGAGGGSADGDATVALLGPSPRPKLPGRLEDVATDVTDPDGSTVRVRGYLAMPDTASEADPAPLLLWVHGGPVSSWNTWSWRWNPWLMVAQGYAVLLPDPALSTGYGQAFIQRGWGEWGAAPYTDVMALTDLVEARADIDPQRTAAMGGSFGGYMANWIAGHTDRFNAIVTHASLWALDQFGPTTDAAFYWGRELSPEMEQRNSPHLSVDQIRTPMLVVHGDKDYRVPIGEGLRLWYELMSKSGLPAGEDGSSPHQFLYFPDENHWVLTPQHAKVWYQVVSAFLARHVLGQEQELPEVLG